MLPEVLSADVCSLRGGEDRAAMACHMRIDEHGRVQEFRFTRALVRIAEVVAYEEAQRRGQPPGPGVSPVPENPKQP